MNLPICPSLLALSECQDNCPNAISDTKPLGRKFHFQVLASLLEFLTCQTFSFHSRRGTFSQVQSIFCQMLPETFSVPLLYLSDLKPPVLLGTLSLQWHPEQLGQHLLRVCFETPTPQPFSYSSPESLYPAFLI